MAGHQQNQQMYHSPSNPHTPASQHVQPPGAPPSNPNMSKSLPQRYCPPASALSPRPYRSRSMAASSPSTGPPGQRFSRPGVGPQGHHISRTTAQGRIASERHDERAMSLTTYPHDHDFSQTASERVTPHRRGDSQGNRYSQASRYRQPSERFSSTPARRSTSYVSKQRTPSSLSTSSSITAPIPSVAPSSNSTVTETTLASRPPASKSGSSRGNGPAPPVRRMPLVYPALLSRVSSAMRDRIIVGDRVKNELAYKSAFTGAEAVDVIS